MVSSEIRICPNCGAGVVGNTPNCPRCDFPLEDSHRKETQLHEDPNADKITVVHDAPLELDGELAEKETRLHTELEEDMIPLHEELARKNVKLEFEDLEAREKVTLPHTNNLFDAIMPASLDDPSTAEIELFQNAQTLEVPKEKIGASALGETQESQPPRMEDTLEDAFDEIIDEEDSLKNPPSEIRSKVAPKPIASVTPSQFIPSPVTEDQQDLLASEIKSPTPVKPVTPVAPIEPVTPPQSMPIMQDSLDLPATAVKRETPADPVESFDTATPVEPVTPPHPMQPVNETPQKLAATEVRREAPAVPMPVMPPQQVPSTLPHAPYTPPPLRDATRSVAPYSYPSNYYLEQRVAAYRSGGYDLLQFTPYQVTLAYGKPLGFFWWIVAMLSVVGLVWYFLILLLSGFSKDKVFLIVERDGTLYEDGAGAAHVRRQRARVGRRWGFLGVVIFFVSLIWFLGMTLGAVWGIRNYRAELAAAYPTISLFESDTNPENIPAETIANAESIVLGFSILFALSFVCLLAGLNMTIVGYLHSQAYDVPVIPLPA